LRILVVGSGGREHALAWKLAQTEKVFATPGNPGIAQVATCHPDRSPLEICKSEAIDLVVVGPEAPLIAGLADELRAAGFLVFGPGAAAAQLEGSKAVSKAWMREANVPTARFETFTDPAKAKAFARTLTAVVVKASGNAAGKGVFVCKNHVEAEDAIDRMLTENAFGEAGHEIVVEERLQGPEFSLLTLVSGRHILSLPVAQDYKRAYDGNRGPNTGGMGSLCPASWVSPDLKEETEQTIVAPIVKLLSEKGIDFRGVLFSGILVQEGRPFCLEYNVRFGDPETQSLLPLLGPEFARALLACAKGEPIPPISVASQRALTVVIAAEGYPESPRKGDPITLPESGEALIFHAGTLASPSLVTSGGRVFGVTAVADSLGQASEIAYRDARKVKFNGAWFRTDIGA
jgi:phosphoribosylamine--glycine ligase